MIPFAAKQVTHQSPVRNAVRHPVHTGEHCVQITLLVTVCEIRLKRNEAP
jgi:hypothetical protein